jgi:hypothetical protein
LHATADLNHALARNVGLQTTPVRLRRILELSRVSCSHKQEH